MHIDNIGFTSYLIGEEKCTSCLYRSGCLHKSRNRSCFKYYNSWYTPDIYVMLMGIPSYEVIDKCTKGKVAK